MTDVSDQNDSNDSKTAQNHFKSTSASTHSKPTNFLHVIPRTARSYEFWKEELIENDSEDIHLYRVLDRYPEIITRYLSKTLPDNNLSIGTYQLMMGSLVSAAIALRIKNLGNNQSYINAFKRSTSSKNARKHENFINRIKRLQKQELEAQKFVKKTGSIQAVLSIPDKTSDALFNFTEKLRDPKHPVGSKFLPVLVKIPVFQKVYEENKLLSLEERKRQHAIKSKRFVILQTILGLMVVTLMFTTYAEKNGYNPLMSELDVLRQMSEEEKENLKKEQRMKKIREWKRKVQEKEE
jgi:hypothetical protein